MANVGVSSLSGGLRRAWFGVRRGAEDDHRHEEAQHEPNIGQHDRTRLGSPVYRRLPQARFVETKRALQNSNGLGAGGKLFHFFQTLNTTSMKQNPDEFTDLPQDRTINIL